jgi:pimeloyl-ACP methyl ester carboxylesterase
MQIASFLQLNQQGKFSEARAMFSARALANIPPGALSQVWKTRIRPHGAYRSFTVTRRVKSDSLQVLVIAADFTGAVISMSFSFNPLRQLEGYFVLGTVPRSAPAPHLGKDTVVSVPGGRIAGSLVLPPSSRKPPVVLIIAGSGPVDRNGNAGAVLQTNTYLLLADSLAAHGIASFRYDKRLVGRSTGFTEPAAGLRLGDFVSDAAALASFLKNDRRFSRLFILGHSEGSLIGMLAARKVRPAGFISVSGAGEPADRVLAWQLSPRKGPDRQKIESILDSLRSGHRVSDIPRPLQALLGPAVQPYLISWMRQDPARVIAGLHTAVLITQGTRDLQVTVRQARLLHEAKPGSELALIPGMNHVLKDAPADRTGNLKTYSEPQLPLDALLVKKIVAFISQAP